MKQVTKQFDNVMDGVNNLIKAIKADYCDGTSYDGSKTKTDVRLEMEEKFKNGVSIKNGQKYIGIYTALGNQSSIWGGVVKKDSACGRLKKGDILKAAGYGTYTMVGAGRRGNVLEGNFNVSWTGANYLI
tara:strand:- start:330 stop:719 length:390 start_codon:yes stop_codon:yes gene_type:complete